MTCREFAVWLDGFIAAANDFNITPKDWETVKEMASKVTDKYNHPGPVPLPPPDRIMNEGTFTRAKAWTTNTSWSNSNNAKSKDNE